MYSTWEIYEIGNVVSYALQQWQMFTRSNLVVEMNFAGQSVHQHFSPYASCACLRWNYFNRAAPNFHMIYENFHLIWGQLFFMGINFSSYMKKFKWKVSNQVLLHWPLFMTTQKSSMRIILFTVVNHKLLIVRVSKYSKTT